MQINITEKKINPFLKRTEIKGTVSFEGVTPSNVQLAGAIAKDVHAKDVSLVVMKHIYTKFSHREAKVEAVVYDTLEAKKLTEKNTKHMKKLAEEAAKKATEAKKVPEAKKEGQ